MSKLLALLIVPCLVMHTAAAAELTGEPTFIYGVTSEHAPNDMGHALAADVDGSLYQTGLEFNPSGLFFLIKYAPDGTIAWRRGFPEAPHSSGYALATVRDGVVAAGSATLEGNDSDGLIVKFDTEGNMVWYNTLGGRGGDSIRGIAVDPDQNLIVTGMTWGAMDGLPDEAVDTFSDGFVAKLSPRGELIWVVRVGGAGQDECKGVVVDAEGGIYTFGETTIDLLSTGQPAGDYIAKFNTDGVMLWAKQFGEDDGGPIRGISLALDGMLFATLNIGVVKLDATGTETWRCRLQDPDSPGVMPMWVTDILADGEGGAFFTLAVMGSLAGRSAGDWDVVVGYLDANGGVPWSRQMGSQGRDLPGGLVTDGGKRIYYGGEVAGVDNRGSDAFVSCMEIEGISMQIPPDRALPPADQ